MLSSSFIEVIEFPGVSVVVVTEGATVVVVRRSGSAVVWLRDWLLD